MTSAGLRAAAKRTPAWLCVTHGADGTYSLARGQLDHIPAASVDVVDTLGAGDVWHGAFALRLAEGAAEGDAIRFANAAAALKCTRPGGREGAPSRTDTETLMQRIS